MIYDANVDRIMQDLVNTVTGFLTIITDAAPG